MNQSPGFADGALSVQDLSAQCAADALAPASGARVLDACAAPGGKSAHLLERDPSLRLLALDIDARRLARARDTYTRTGVGEGAQTRVAAPGAALATEKSFCFDTAYAPTCRSRRALR